ncbi:MAG: MGMT family protein [Bacillota bacterium]
MNGFFQQVYDLIATIPEGKVATYGQIAALLGKPKASKIVGWALHTTPSNFKLPCHRVVNKSGDLAPAYVFGGIGAQRSLLEAEGITFNSDGRVNLKKHLW